jgi:hypothetical protein
MGNHMMEHRRPQVNIASPRVLKTTIIETQTQPTRITIIQSLNTIITTIGVEMMVVHIMEVVGREWLLDLQQIWVVDWVEFW